MVEMHPFVCGLYREKKKISSDITGIWTDRLFVDLKL